MGGEISQDRSRRQGGALYRERWTTPLLQPPVAAVFTEPQLQCCAGTSRMSRPRAANQRCAIHPVHAFHFRRNVGCEWRAGSSARHTFRHIRGRHHSSAVSQWAGGVGASGHVLRWGRRCRELLCTWPHHGPGGTVAVGRSAPSPRAAGGAFAIGLRLPRALGAVPAELPARALRALSPRALWALSTRALGAERKSTSMKYSHRQ